LLLVVLAGCGQSVPDCRKVIDIDPFLKSHKALNLSDIAADVKYVQLESSVTESLIGRIGKIAYFNHRYFIYDHQTNRILAFSEEGKYLFQIDRIGKGPGEYLQIADFTILPADSSICIVDNDALKFIKYDMAGKYLIDMRLHTISHNIAALNDSLIVLQFNFPEFIMNDKFSINIYDRNMNRLSSLLPQNTNFPKERVGYFPGHSCNFFSHANDTLTLWEYRNDIVYKIINERETVNGYYIQFSQKLLQGDEKGYFEVPPDKNELVVFMETKNHMFMRGTTFGETFHLVYFKDRNTGYNIVSNSGDELRNDMDEGPNFFPDGIMNDGRAYKSFSLYEHRNNRKTVPKEFESQKISLTDNPCIMIVDLK
jgi:hypothetical protein